MAIVLTLAMVGVAWVALRPVSARALAARRIAPPPRERGRR